MKNKGMENENVHLMKHQQRTVSLMRSMGANRKEDGVQKGLIAFHSTGAGKTLTAYMTAKYLLHDETIKRAIFLVPASSLDQAKDVPQEFGIETPEHFHIETHNKWIQDYKKFLNEGKAPEKKELFKLSQSLLIIDEVHTFKKEIDSVSAQNTNADKMLKACYKAKRVLLLTASPMMNHPRDIVNYLGMIEGIKNPNELQQRYSDLELFPDEHLQCKFSYFKKKEDEEGYPSVYYHTKSVVMDDDYLEKYKHIADNKLGELYEKLKIEGEEKEMRKIQESFGTDTDKNLKSFLFGVRQAVNNIGKVSPKIKAAVQHIRASVDKGLKVLLYSEWIENGTELIEKRLKDIGYSYVKITGKMKTSERQRSVIQFNTENKAPYILLINKSGAQAID